MDRDSHSTQQLEAQAGTDQPPIRLGDDPNMCSHCNAPHTGFLSCFHYQVTVCLMNAHMQLSDESPETSPVKGQTDIAGEDEDQSPNPTLQSLFRLDHSDATAIILSQRLPEMPEIADRMAALIIMYRLLKWRLHPTSVRVDSVPPFYRPTPTQLLVPHPVTIDFLAFPALRDVLIQDDSLYLDADPDAFACFERDFTENLTVQWPPLEPLVVRASPNTYARGAPRFKLNPAFETHILNFGNWAMRDAWITKYPNLAQYVNRCRPSFAKRPGAMP
ncbi:unnamed protein product [Fusarium graminearum]|nr:unnamed protein product [Fusarium graminearum]